jgi:glycosyltransferase involved in cell wall biosynthesis
LGIDAGAFLLVAVGNLYPVKGYDVLLRALARLEGGRDDWHLAIAGRGGEETPLKVLAADLQLSEKVRFLGFRSDIGDLLAAANLFVMPSRSESHPLALLEAMFAGLPIVVSAVGGVPETVEHDREALLVSPEDDAALAAAIQVLMTDPERRSRLGQAARQRAEAHFTVTAMADAYERAYGGS